MSLSFATAKTPDVEVLVGTTIRNLITAQVGDMMLLLVFLAKLHASEIESKTEAWDCELTMTCVGQACDEGLQSLIFLAAPSPSEMQSVTKAVS